MFKLFFLLFPKRFHKNITNSLFFLLLVGLIVRLFLMAFTIHPDFFFIHMFPNLIVNRQESNIYRLFETEFSNRQGFYYNPIVLYFFSSVQFVFSPINLGFDGFMNKAFTLEKAANSDPIAYFQPIQTSYYLNFLLMKSPYLLFEVGLLFLLLKFAKTWVEAKRILLLMVFNPVILYGVYAFGQFDIVPAFLLILGITLCLKEKPILGMLIIGTAATFKNFALLAILPAVLIFGQSLKQRITLFIVGISPFLVSAIIVFLEASSQTIYTFIPKFYIAKTTFELTTYSLVSRTLRLLALAVSYLIVIILSLKLRIKTEDKILGLVLIALISLFALSPVILLHYTIISLPLMIIFFRKENWFPKVFFLYIASIAIFKLWTRIQQFGLLAPINKEFYYSTPSTSEIINQVFPYSYVSSFFYIIFFVVSLFLIFQTLKKLLFEAD